jgi:hypothetical protein
MKGPKVELLDVSALGYEERLLASALQGLVNRAAGEGREEGARLFLDYGVYDDPSTRRTNSVMMTEEDWFGRYREFLATSDLDNLAYYREAYGIETERLAGLDEALRRHRSLVRGLVVYDPGFEASVNLALVYAGLDDLLVAPPRLLPWAQGFGLELTQDLRGRFGDRAELYRWAFENLWPRCKKGAMACHEPAWKRPEFADYIVENRLFAIGLASFEKGGLRDLGHGILLFLAAGPWALRAAAFGLRLDRPLRSLALRLLSSGSGETALMVRVLRNVEALPYPTVFGWHVDRDDELSFMLLVSACGARLVPSFMASNFSFHSSLPAPASFAQPHLDPAAVKLEEDKVYLSFTLSDGDQLALMNTAELGGFRRPERGGVPFNWEVQPLLAELAPALLGFYFSRLRPNDLLVAGPSGAGYVMPPLVPDLAAYFRVSAEVCAKAGIRVVTSYNGDPPGRVLRDHQNAKGIIGFMAGYFHLGRRPAYLVGDKPFVANAWPSADAIGASRDETLDGIRALVEAEGPLPRFVGCHLFAYRTNVADVAAFAKTLDPAKVKIVRGDEFLAAAALWMRNGIKGGSHV